MGVVLAATLAGLSGCGGDAKADGSKKATAAAAPSLEKATAAFQDAVAENANGSCPQEAGTCWDEMTRIMGPARTLRKAMKAHKGVSAEFWSPAYAIIDKMEDGYAVGKDQGGGIANVTSNRVTVFGGAHDLSDWLDEHPVE
ncbi:hypothetical protein [Streptomyces sp. NPDC004546]|uniref:hypothetical protein n=1 Tax=Streptomyces sp. NPDC004546 TaxID=3154282 RepID=UPI0033B1C1F7